MKFLKRLILLILIVSIFGGIASLFMMVQSEPEISMANAPGPQDLSQAQIFIENSDPRELEPGEVSAFTVNERDLELVIGYGLSQLEGGAAQIDFNRGLADVLITAKLPENPLGEYLNAQVTVAQSGNSLTVENLRVGSISIPGALADRVLLFVHEQMQEVPEYVAALNAINGYSISQDRLNVVYQWQPDLLKQISSRGREFLISPEDQERLLAHASNLASITNDPSIDRVVSVADLLNPMMLFAKVRAGDPVEENRAAILALSMYIMGISPARVVGMPESSVPPTGKHQLMLSDRHDFAQHFLVSAGLAVSSGSGISDTIGLLKELEDSQGGSGFSFTDIGADKTGVRFAELAVSNAANARAIQDKFSFGMAERDFMAEFRDLPEFMDGPTFQRIYGGVGTPAYDAVIDDIENRISKTRLFTELDK